MALLLYLPVAVMLLWLARRHVTPFGLVAGAVLLLLPFLFCGKALLTGGVYAPVDLPYVTEPLKLMREPIGVGEPHNGVLSDLYAQMIPWRKALQYALSHRQWPLWNPFMLSGDLLAASAQPAAYSPFTLLACLLPIAHGLTFSAAMSFFLAALGAYLLARELGCRDSVALFAAGAWMYAKPLAFFILWSIGASWAFFPLLLLATRRVVWQPALRSAAFLMIILTLILLAGHPETFIQAVFVGAFYGAFELARRVWGNPPATADGAPARASGGLRASAPLLLRVGLATLGAGAAAAGLCAIYILPIFEAAPETMEHAYRTGDWAKQSHGAILRESGVRLLTDFMPWIHGMEWRVEGVKYLPLDSAAAGSVVLALALYALWRVRSSQTWFWGGVALFGMLCRAAWTPVMDLLSKLPLLDVTLNERFSFAAAFAIVVLAALGLEYALAHADIRPLGMTMAALLAVLAAARVVIMRADLVTDALPEWGVYACFGELACLAAAVIILYARPPLRALVPLLIVVLLAQRQLEDGDVYPTLPLRAAYPPIPILQAIHRDQGPFRVVGQYFALVPGTSALYELEDVRGYEALTFLRYFGTYKLWCTHQPVWFNRVDSLKPFLNFLNVRYAISSATTKPAEGWNVVARQRGAQLMENSNVIERAFIPHTVRLGMPEEEALAQMATETNFREHAWIQTPGPTELWTNAGGTLHLTRRDAGFKIDADMRGAGWVIISEPAWAGWRIYIDERRVQWFYANQAFLGVYVPAGKHTLRIAFLPDAFVRGRAISLVTLLGVIGVGVWRRRSPGERSDEDECRETSAECRVPSAERRETRDECRETSAE